RRELQFFRRGSGGGAVAFGRRLRGGRRRRRRRDRGVRVHSGFVSLSISFHSASNPSPVTAETGSTESSNTDSNALSARIRSPLASLSIFIATTDRRSTLR